MSSTIDVGFRIAPDILERGLMLSGIHISGLHIDESKRLERFASLIYLYGLQDGRVPAPMSAFPLKT